MAASSGNGGSVVGAVTATKGDTITAGGKTYAIPAGGVTAARGSVTDPSSVIVP